MPIFNCALLAASKMSSYEVVAIGKKSLDGPFEKLTVGRVRTSDFDVDIDVKYCGLCHTDLHLVSLTSTGGSSSRVV